MGDLEVEVSLGRIRAIPCVNVANNTILLAGPGELMGWSFRESGSETGLEVSGTAVAPAANQSIATLSNVPVGLYSISWSVELIGAAAAADAANFVLSAAGSNLVVSENPGAAGQYPQLTVQASLPIVSSVAVKAIGAGTAGVTYGAEISVIPVPQGQAIIELQDGNSPLGEVTAGVAGSLSQWFGPEGIRFYNGIHVATVNGQMTGVVYARYARAMGWT